MDKTRCMKEGVVGWLAVSAFDWRVFVTAVWLFFASLCFATFHLSFWRCLIVFRFFVFCNLALFHSGVFDCFAIVAESFELIQSTDNSQLAHVLMFKWTFTCFMNKEIKNLVFPMFIVSHQNVLIQIKPSLLGHGDRFPRLIHQRIIYEWDHKVGWQCK